MKGPLYKLHLSNHILPHFTGKIFSWISLIWFNLGSYTNCSTSSPIWLFIIQYIRKPQWKRKFHLIDDALCPSLTENPSCCIYSLQTTSSRQAFSPWRISAFIYRFLYDNKQPKTQLFRLRGGWIMMLGTKIQGDSLRIVDLNQPEIYLNVL